MKIVYSACALLSLTGALIANPSTPTVVSGDVSFDSSTSGVLVVGSTSERSIINWEDFSIDIGELTSFQLPDSSSAILNRVTTSVPSSILGNLESNGVVYLINPNGILIGPSSVCSLNTFLASTLDALDEEFLAGGDMSFTSNTDNSVVHYGAILTDGGDVILLGHQVFQEGSIIADGGSVAIGAARQVTLHPTDQDKISIILQAPESNSLTGLSTSSGSYLESIEAELKADGNLYAMAINHTGWVNAKGIENRDGRILFSAEDGEAFIDGNAANRNLDTNVGGPIFVYAETLTLGDNCVLDASGQAGGGVIHVGSGLMGSDAPFNAQNIVFEAGALVNADAGFENDGGEVVVWADDTTDFYGTINSRGGSGGGDGGLVEVSGVNYLDFSGTVDNTAPMGTDGLLLLDPQELVFNPKSLN